MICNTCGLEKNIEEFPRCRGRVGISLSRARMWYRATRTQMVEEEIAKCDLVCANCHRVRTQALYNPRRGDNSKKTG